MFVQTALRRRPKFGEYVDIMSFASTVIYSGLYNQSLIEDATRFTFTYC